MTPTACDQILKEYKEFLRNYIVFSREKFSNYDKQKDRHVLGNVFLKKKKERETHKEYCQ